ncbi:hypothetical protein, partial [Providencia rustigianii]
SYIVVLLSFLLMSCAKSKNYAVVDHYEAKKEIEEMENSLAKQSILTDKCRKIRSDITKEQNYYESSYHSRSDLVQLSCLSGSIDGLNNDLQKLKRKVFIAQQREETNSVAYRELGYAEIQEQYIAGFVAGNNIWNTNRINKERLQDTQRQAERNEIQKIAQNESKRKSSPSNRKEKQKPSINMPECKGIATDLTQNAIPKGVTLTLDEYKKFVGDFYIVCFIGGVNGHQHKRGIPSWVRANGRLYLKAYQRGYDIGKTK